MAAAASGLPLGSLESWALVAGSSWPGEPLRSVRGPFFPAAAAGLGRAGSWPLASSRLRARGSNQWPSAMAAGTEHNDVKLALLGPVHQAQPQGQKGRMVAIAGPELVAQVVEVAFDRFRAEVEPRGDLTVLQAQ